MHECLSSINHLTNLKEYFTPSFWGFVYTWNLLCARHCSKHFVNLSSLNPQTKLMQYVLLKSVLQMRDVRLGELSLA